MLFYKQHKELKFYYKLTNKVENKNTYVIDLRYNFSLRQRRTYCMHLKQFVLLTSVHFPTLFSYDLSSGGVNARAVTRRTAARKYSGTMPSGLRVGIEMQLFM